MTTLHKIYGGAGCGETYHLMQELERLLKSGIPISSIAMMTLTRSARKEFVERANVISRSSKQSHRWFGTMHSLTWRMLGLNFKHNALTPLKKSLFFNKYEKYPSGKLPFLSRINEVRRNCEFANDDDGLMRTRDATGIDFRYRSNTGRYSDLTIDEMIEFNDAWDEFMVSNNVYDFTRMIAEAHAVIKDGSLEPAFDYLFVDEFQDFSPLQHSLYIELSKHMLEVWFCGDDWQVVYRFTGASPSFLIDDPVSHGCETILPKTWRYGGAILDNSLKYIDGISTKKTRDIMPLPIDGSVKSIYGDMWENYIGADDGTSAYLVRTNKQVSQIANALDRRGVIYALLGREYSNIEGMLRNYNTLVSMENDKVISIDDVRVLVDQLPHVMILPATQTEIDGSCSVNKKQLTTRGIKKSLNNSEYVMSLQDSYTRDEFCEVFLNGRAWNDVSLFNHVNGMKEFACKYKLTYPHPFGMEIKHMVGTIHKFKGNEADNVFLFRQIPYPISENVLFDKLARDDERRIFYVGATRARRNLYEIDDLFVDRNRNVLPSVGSIL